MRRNIIIRIRSGIIHIQLKSTGIITVIPITAEISDITAIQIRIIELVCCAFLLDNISIVRHPCSLLQIHQARRNIIKRTRSGTSHIQRKSTGIITVTPITAEISDTTATQIRIIGEVCG